MSHEQLMRTKELKILVNILYLQVWFVTLFPWQCLGQNVSLG